MARGRSNQVLVRRIRNGQQQGRVPDRVIAEEALEIRLDGQLVATTMRTPGHDYELAAGFLYAEGHLAGAPVREIRYCGTGTAVTSGFNVVSVDTGGAAPVPAARLGTTTSSCGACGADVDALVARLGPLPPGSRPPIIPAVLVALPAAVRECQELFAATGSVHAAAAFTAATGEVMVVREDVGRHNAVDKVVGRMLLDRRLPAEGLGLFVSGRVSFEIVQKAWAAGFGMVAAVSGPTGLAVATAERAGMSLVGFVRNGSLNVYAETAVS